MTASLAQIEHRRFLNAYYGISRHFYDLTRKYYLIGRDRELDRLSREQWRSLVEMGPGTGRNLVKLHRFRPDAKLAGVEASDEMLNHARKHCPFATLSFGFAETCNIEQLLKHRPDRILFSYCLSMVMEPEQAIRNAQRALGPGGEVVVVDFGDFERLPPRLGSILRGWLRAFHVHPLEATRLRNWGGRVESSFGGYVISARFGPMAERH